MELADIAAGHTAGIEEVRRRRAEILEVLKVQLGVIERTVVAVGVGITAGAAGAIAVEEVQAVKP